MVMKLPVSAFKARCTQVLREIDATYETVEVTKRGRTVAIVNPVPETDRHPLWGALRGSVVEVADDFDEPLDDKEWDAAR